MLDIELTLDCGHDATLFLIGLGYEIGRDCWEGPTQRAAASSLPEDGAGLELAPEAVN